MAYEEPKATEHFTAHVKIIRTRKQPTRAPVTGAKGEQRDSITLAEISVQADTLEELTRKMRGHIALVDESGEGA